MLATAMNRERKRGITSAVSKLALLSALIDWLDHRFVMGISDGQLSFRVRALDNVKL